MFKQHPVGTKGSRVCQENIRYYTITPQAAWTIDTRQDGSMISCCLCLIMTWPSEWHSGNLLICDIILNRIWYTVLKPPSAWRPFHSNRTAFKKVGDNVSRISSPVSFFFKPSTSAIGQFVRHKYNVFLVVVFFCN